MKNQKYTWGFYPACGPCYPKTPSVHSVDQCFSVQFSFWAKREACKSHIILPIHYRNLKICKCRSCWFWNNKHKCDHFRAIISKQRKSITAWSLTVQDNGLLKKLHSIEKSIGDTSSPLRSVYTMFWFFCLFFDKGERKQSLIIHFCRKK